MWMGNPTHTLIHTPPHPCMHTHAHTCTHMHTHAHTCTHTHAHTPTHAGSCSFLPVISSDNENSPAAAYNVKGKQAGGRGRGTRPAVTAAPSTKSLASVKKGAS